MRPQTHSSFLDLVRTTWHQSSMPIFAERFLLAVLAGAFIILLFTNPMGFDLSQRLSGAVAVVAAAYFVAHTLHKSKTSIAEPLRAVPTMTTTPAAVSNDAAHPSNKDANMSDKKPDQQIIAGANSTISTNQQGGVTAGSIGTLNMHAMQPRVEGVRASMEQIPSPREDAPYAIQIAVQVSSSIQPFAIAVECNKDIVDATFKVISSSVSMNVQTGHLNRAPKRSYYLSLGSPPITPSTPLLITVMCREPFEVLAVERQH